MNKKLLLGSFGLVLVVALVLAVGTALASTGSGGELCGGGVGAGTQGANGLLLKKDVSCEKSGTWLWNITKTVDQTNLLLSTGQSQVVNYAVTAGAVFNGSYHVSGEIIFQNTSAAPIEIANVTDTLGPVTCALSFPFTVPARNLVSCTYDGVLSYAPTENSVTVTDSSGVEITHTVPIDWSKAVVTETDKCAAISDTLGGALGTVCAGDHTSFSFSYPWTVGPYAVCGSYTVDNTATFTTNDSGATGSASQTVNVTVPCAGGCSLTPGYWKTHSIFGPAPYDDTWALLGENTPFYFSGASYYTVLWTPPQGGNAYYILAHAFIAAKLNGLNGADLSAAQTAYDAAAALFSNPANTPAYVGGLRGSAKATWTNLATILDNYNNGLIGPGHCSE